ncbi:MAG: L-Ala-D/L-Glu epimerase [Magnetovibrio sp.]|nr:L-Ala-D/L-Glu epimerase [Magnetovibrio sp.]
MTRELSVSDEAWPLARPFAISRGTKTEAHVVVAEIAEGEVVGRGECVPYARYEETVHGVSEQIKGQTGAVAFGLDGFGLNERLPAGAARNALDAALWDWQAKAAGARVWELMEMDAPAPAVCATTIGIGSAEEMAERAAELAATPLIKVKLDAEDVIPRMEAVRAGAPEARLIIDPNEGWTAALLAEVAPALAAMGVEMIEQPLPAGDDAALADYDSPVPICADESCHTVTDLPGLVGKYQMINIKLDKTGGLTEALFLARAAEKVGMKMMVGCMVATSLAMAPATLLGPFAEFVDLDGPLLLKDDRPDGLRFEAGRVHAPDAALWG